MGSEEWTIRIGEAIADDPQMWGTVLIVGVFCFFVLYFSDRNNPGR